MRAIKSPEKSRKIESWRKLAGIESRMSKHESCDFSGGHYNDVDG